MYNNRLNISDIETYLNGVLDGKVSENTFFTTYPNTAYVLASDWQDMVVVTIPSGIQDFDAMGSGYVLIGLYARPMDSGKKNVAKMSELENKLNIALENSTHSGFALFRNNAYANYDEDLDWHCNVVELKLLVV